MNLDFYVDLIKERKREIFIVLIYIIIFSVLAFVFNNKKIEKEDKEFDFSIAEAQYTRTKNIASTEDELKEEVKEKIKEFAELDKKLPVNLKNQDINQKLAEIASNTDNLFSLSNCSVSEHVTDNLTLNAYQVKVKSISGSYYQIKKFLKYIEEYDSKVVITQLDLNRDMENVKGTLTLVFYGEVREEEEVL